MWSLGLRSVRLPHCFSPSFGGQATFATWFSRTLRIQTNRRCQTPPKTAARFGLVWLGEVAPAGLIVDGSLGSVWTGPGLSRSERIHMHQDQVDSAGATAERSSPIPGTDFRSGTRLCTSQEASCALTSSGFAVFASLRSSNTMELINNSRRSMFNRWQSVFSSSANEH